MEFLATLDAVRSAWPASNALPSHGVPSLRPAACFVPISQEELEQAVSRRFEQQVRLHPNRPAIRAQGRAFTYAELNSVANRLARAIQARVGTESEPVLLLLDKGPALFAAMLAVLKAAKFYVPLSPAYPAARNALIADDSRARLIVTDAAHIESARAFAARAEVINTDELAPDLDDSDLDVAVGPDDYAYIIYTSGSTGRPKGVVDTHRNLLQNIRRYTNSHFLSADDRLVCANSCAFSNSLKDIYGALLNGGCLFPVDITRDGLACLTEVLIRDRISVLNVVATVFRNLVASLRPEDAFPACRIVRVGSEAVTRKDVDLFKRHFPRSCVLVNGYGTTETGTVRVNFVDHDTEVRDSTLPIGYAVDGTDVLLLDEAGRAIAECERIGQIAVRSAYLSPGYWKRPDLTAAAFQHDPAGSHRRIYLTGDLGLLRPDGCLVYAGRRDFQVKVRGNRIEVAEIEMALMDSPLVKGAVVMARDDQPEDRALVAYVVPRPGLPALPSAHELRVFLKGRLPDCAIPATYVLLDELPRTPTGKVDRRALPAPSADRPGQNATFIAPRDATESRLAEMWEQLLSVRPIGAQDNFFDLGGNSLLAAVLQVRISKMFGKQLPLSMMFGEGTIEHLARLLRGNEVKPRQTSLVAIQPQGSRPAFFCVHGIGGEVLSFNLLARHLGPDQPFFGFDAPALVGTETPEVQVEALAKRYLEELLTVQPRGPYYLGGYSFGGAVAYEMAQRLRAIGHQVALLALIDQRRPNLDPAITLDGQHFRAYLKNLARWIRHEVWRYRPRQIASRLGGIAARVVRASCRRLRIPGIGPETPRVDGFLASAGVPESYRCLLAARLAALRQYVPHAYEGPAILLRAQIQPICRWQDADMGWGRLVGNLTVKEVPGAHDSILTDPHVQALAAELRMALNRAVSGVAKKATKLAGTSNNTAA
jgi:amino acid adenylation domain-containing protein